MIYVLCICRYVADLMKANSVLPFELENPTELFAEARTAVSDCLVCGWHPSGGRAFGAVDGENDL